MDAELQELPSESFAGGSIKTVNYKGVCVPEVYMLIADAIENFEVRDDDIWICSFPKAGTTWSQELIWNILYDNDFDAEKATPPISFPFFEFTKSTTKEWISVKNVSLCPNLLIKSVEYASEMPSPRLIKTHLPFHLLPRQLRTGKKKSKIIYMGRTTKDVCISYYNHYRLFEGYIDTFQNFMELFFENKVYFAPYWKHVSEYWNMKKDENVLYLKYEDIKINLPCTIKNIATFLNKSLNEQYIKELEEYLNFANVNINISINNPSYVQTNSSKLKRFKLMNETECFGKGSVISWQTIMTTEQINRFEEWATENIKLLYSYDCKSPEAILKHEMSTL